jgi:phage terminase large subunit GpA-like protein
MDHELARVFAKRIAEGLKRKNLTTCSRWACECRVMGQPFPGRWTFDHHPWLRGMHDSEAELNVGQKAAQMGFTETVLNIVFYHIDIKAVDCLYVLPAKTPDASDFSAARFDPALESSPHLASLFSDVKNVGHKRAGSANLLYPRLSQPSRPQVRPDRTDRPGRDRRDDAIEHPAGDGAGRRPGREDGLAHLHADD